MAQVQNRPRTHFFRLFKDFINRGPLALPYSTWVLESMWGTLEPLSYDANTVVIDRLPFMEKIFSVLKVGFLDS